MSYIRWKNAKHGREQALKAWRDKVVDRFRRFDFGSMPFHEETLLSKLHVERIQIMLGLKPAPNTGYFSNFTDTRSTARAMRENDASLINWCAKGKNPDYFDFRGWSTYFWNFPNDTSLPNKFLLVHANMMYDFPRKWWQIYHKNATLGDYTHGWDCGGYNWGEASSHLYEAMTVNGVILNFAGIAKLLGKDRLTPPLKYEVNENVTNFLAPRLEPLERDEYDLVDPLLLSRMVVGLHEFVFRPLFQFAYLPGAVPNQRREALVPILMMTILFPEYKGQKERLQMSLQAFEQYVGTNFLPDGSMLEQSFNYNLLDLRQLEGLAEYLISNGAETADEANRLKELTQRASVLLSYLTTPFGTLPRMASYMHMGNTFNRTSPSAVKFTRDETVTSIGFPYSGYFAFRSGWKTDDAFMFFYNNRPQRGHQMRGTLGVQISAYGREMILPGGPDSYGFTKNDDSEITRKFFSESSSWKTNTVIQNGQSQAWNKPVFEVAPKTAVSGAFFNGGLIHFVDGVYDGGYWNDSNEKVADMSMNHYRSVAFVPSLKLWIMLDQMNPVDPTNKNNNNKAFSQIWNFPPNLKSYYGFNEVDVSAVSTQKEITTTDSTGPNIAMKHFGPRNLSYKKYFGDRKEIKGWFSKNFGEPFPSVNIYANWNYSDSPNLLTFINPLNKGEKVPYESKEIRQGNTIGFQVSSGQIQISAITSPQSVLLNSSQISAQGTHLLVVRSDGKTFGVAKGLKTNQIIIGNVRYNAPSQDVYFEFVEKQPPTFKSILTNAEKLAQDEKLAQYVAQDEKLAQYVEAQEVLVSTTKDIAEAFNVKPEFLLNQAFKRDLKQGLNFALKRGPPATTQRIYHLKRHAEMLGPSDIGVTQTLLGVPKLRYAKEYKSRFSWFNAGLGIFQEGFIRIIKKGTYEFSLRDDLGPLQLEAELSIFNSKIKEVVNPPDIQGNMINLSPGYYRFQLDYRYTHVLRDSAALFYRLDGQEWQAFPDSNYFYDNTTMPTQTKPREMVKNDPWDK